jgi:hypothetical protein
MPLRFTLKRIIELDSAPSHLPFASHGSEWSIFLAWSSTWTYAAHQLDTFLTSTLNTDAVYSSEMLVYKQKTAGRKTPKCHYLNHY